MPAMSDDKFCTVTRISENMKGSEGSPSESIVTNDTVRNNCPKQLQKRGKISGKGTELLIGINISCNSKTVFTENDITDIIPDGKTIASKRNSGHYRPNLSQTQEDNSHITPIQVESYDNSRAITNSYKKSPNDFIFGKYIGEGSFSIVYLAVDVQTKREYAIKVCEKRHILREHKQEYVRREREAMNIMSNVAGFVNLSCTFQDQRSLYFVMTYAKYGDLLPYINKVGSFNVDCTRHYAAELVLACEEMHRRNVVHRDLKPENILLDERMHTLIADFGSAKILTPGEHSKTLHREQEYKGNCERVSENVDSTGDFNLQGGITHKRRESFVGTAQYVSPEVLQSGPVTPAADLWALGCIIYQMMSGLPPFRGSNDYIVFKEILACNLEFPQGFNKNAEDLVRRLLKIDPFERLGALDKTGYYESIRSHQFFDGLIFDTIRESTPPTIHPYVPEIAQGKNICSNSYMPEYLEPGLNDKQLTRLLGMKLGTVRCDSLPNNDSIGQHTVIKNFEYFSEEEKNKRLEQQEGDKWNVFADNEVILKKGFINKRKGLFARKRMLLLTTGPRLIYIDPTQMIKKGEIPWSNELRVEAKNFKIFLVHTPNRTYYLEDPEGYSLEWVRAIENMHLQTYKDSILDEHCSISKSKPTQSSEDYTNRSN